MLNSLRIFNSHNIFQKWGQQWNKTQPYKKCYDYDYIDNINHQKRLENRFTGNLPALSFISSCPPHHSRKNTPPSDSPLSSAKKDI